MSEIINITTELLELIYKRAAAYATIKFGHGDPDDILIHDDGTISARWLLNNRNYNDDIVENFSSECLTEDLDEVARQRAERVEKERKERLIKEAERREAREKQEKEQRKATYLKLKKEFES